MFMRFMGAPLRPFDLWCSAMYLHLWQDGFEFLMAGDIRLPTKGLYMGFLRDAREEVCRHAD